MNGAAGTSSPTPLQASTLGAMAVTSGSIAVNSAISASKPQMPPGNLALGVYREITVLMARAVQSIMLGAGTPASWSAGPSRDSMNRPWAA
jgi:hypothetical protein